MSAADFTAMTERMPLRKHFYRQMSEAGFPETTIAESKEKLRKALERVEAALADGRAYLLGADYTIADIVFVPTVVRMEDLGLDELWADLPHVAAWFSRVQARPSFATAYMPGARVDPDAYTIKQGVPRDARAG